MYYLIFTQNIERMLFSILKSFIFRISSFVSLIELRQRKLVYRFIIQFAIDR